VCVADVVGAGDGLAVVDLGCTHITLHLHRSTAQHSTAQPGGAQHGRAYRSAVCVEQLCTRGTCLHMSQNEAAHVIKSKTSHMWGHMLQITADCPHRRSKVRPHITIPAHHGRS
jgi:hypothetical protein